MTLNRNSPEWYAELANAGRLFDEWGGNLATDPLPEEIQESLRKAGIIKKLPSASPGPVSS